MAAKGWQGHTVDWRGEYGDYLGVVIAETRGQARRWLAHESEFDFLDVRVQRAPEFDDVAMTRPLPFGPSVVEYLRRGHTACCFICDTLIADEHDPWVLDEEDAVCDRCHAKTGKGERRLSEWKEST